jgi:hypothetical protein
VSVAVLILDLEKECNGLGTWVQKRPTPPEAAVMRIFNLGPDPSSLRPTRLMALWRAVMAATGSDAASTAVIVGGLFTVDVTGARAYSANPPPLCTYYNSMSTNMGVIYGTPLPPFGLQDITKILSVSHMH